jgi:hypothetical protein
LLCAVSAVAVDPDVLLQRLLDFAERTRRRLLAKEKSAVPCEHCGQKPGLEQWEHLLLQRNLRIVAQVAFGGRKLVTDKLLRQLSEGEIDRLDASAAAQTEGGWLPKV